MKVYVIWNHLRSSKNPLWIASFVDQSTKRERSLAIHVLVAPFAVRRGFAELINESASLLESPSGSWREGGKPDVGRFETKNFLLTFGWTFSRRSRLLSRNFSPGYVPGTSFWLSLPGTFDAAAAAAAKHLPGMDVRNFRPMREFG